MGSDLESCFGDVKKHMDETRPQVTVVFLNLTLPHGGSRGLLGKQATPSFKRSTSHAQNCEFCFRGNYLTKTVKECFGGLNGRHKCRRVERAREKKGNT